MRKYDNYKQSGFEWLGEIPEHWEAQRLKDIVKNGLKYGANEAAVDDNRNNPRFIRITDFDDNGNLKDDTFKSIKYATAKDYLLKEGDILFARSGATVGKTFLFTSFRGLACYAGYLIRATPDKKIASSEYLYYFTQSTAYTEWKNNIFIQATIQNISADKYYNLFCTVPPLPEQTAIATYLDQQTQTIDKKTALLTQKIAYYKELRKALINRAVTKGIADNVEMKDSGVEWIGEIPRHWQPFRLKDIGYLYSGLSGKSGDDFNQDDNLNNKGFIPFTNIANNTYLKKDHLGTVVIFEKEKQNSVKKGDIFFLMSSEGHEDIGKTAVLDEEIKETYLNSFCKGYRLTQKFCYPNFINYLLLSTNYRSRFIVEGKGFTRINLKMEKVTDFSVFLPPTLQEQIAIATYLDQKTNIIDSIVSNIEKQIVTLSALRKTLINEVVTGKVKVYEL